MSSTIPEAFKIRGGFRRHLARLRQLRDERRRLVAVRFAEDGMPHGAQAELAAAIGCNRSTICRDLACLKRQAAAAVAG
jgi:hypothetical protein